MTSMLGVFSIPLGRLCCRGVGRLRTQERLERGLIILLPGIQGKSHIESSVAKGLNDAGIDLAIEVHDWTTGCWWLFPYHLRALNRNRKAANDVANRVCEYREQYPGRPVHIIGHSGGAGIALLAAEALPVGVKVTNLILLAPAVSPDYTLDAAVEHVECKVCCYWSRFDLLFLGIGTLVLGTIDRRHVAAAGARGFTMETILSTEAVDQCDVHQQPYVAQMFRSWNAGGHFGCTNRVFVNDWLAPLLTFAASDRQQ